MTVFYENIVYDIIRVTKKFLKNYIKITFFAELYHFKQRGPLLWITVYDTTIYKVP